MLSCWCGIWTQPSRTNWVRHLFICWFNQQIFIQYQPRTRHYTGWTKYTSNYNPAGDGNWKGRKPEDTLDREGDELGLILLALLPNQSESSHIEGLETWSLLYKSWGESGPVIRMSSCSLALNQTGQFLTRSSGSVSVVMAAPPVFLLDTTGELLTPRQQPITHQEKPLTDQHCIYFQLFCHGFWQIFALKFKGKLRAFLEEQILFWNAPLTNVNRQQIHCGIWSWWTRGIQRAPS